MKLKIKRVDKDLPIPEKDPSAAAGFDFYCREGITIAPHQLKLVAINNVVAVPEGYFLLLAIRSSTPWKKGLLLANGVGIIDPFFSGDEDELRIQLYNFTDKPVTVERGERLAQGILVKHESVEWEEVDSFGRPGHGGYKTA